MQKKYLYLKKLNRCLRKLLFEHESSANIEILGVYVTKDRTIIVYEELSSYGFKTNSLLLMNVSKE